MPLSGLLCCALQYNNANQYKMGLRSREHVIGFNFKFHFLLLLLLLWLFLVQVVQTVSQCTLFSVVIKNNKHEMRTFIWLPIECAYVFGPRSCILALTKWKVIAGILEIVAPGRVHFRLTAYVIFLLFLSCHVHILLQKSIHLRGIYDVPIHGSIHMGFPNISAFGCE